MHKIWTIQDLSKKMVDYFKELGFNNPRLEVELLLADILKTDRLTVVRVLQGMLIHDLALQRNVNLVETLIKRSAKFAKEGQLKIWLRKKHRDLDNKKPIDVLLTSEITEVLKILPI